MSGKKQQGDKYIIDVIKSSHLTAQHFVQYLEDFLNSLPAAIRDQIPLLKPSLPTANDTDESSSSGKRLHPLPSLGLTAKATEESPAKKRTCLFSPCKLNYLHQFILF